MEKNHIKYSEEIIPVATMEVDGVMQEVRLDFFIAKDSIPNPNGYRNIRHKNRNLLDCRRDNLEWVP